MDEEFREKWADEQIYYTAFTSDDLMWTQKLEDWKNKSDTRNVSDTLN